MTHVSIANEDIPWMEEQVQFIRVHGMLFKFGEIVRLSVKRSNIVAIPSKEAFLRSSPCSSRTRIHLQVLLKQDCEETKSNGTFPLAFFIFAHCLDLRLSAHLQ
jgi:hypothetical protein